MKIVVYEVGKESFVADIENELAECQKIVGGYIQVVTVGNGMLLVCNEEGKNIGLEPNRYIPEIADVICGNFFVCGAGEDDFTSLTDEQIKEIRERWN